MDVVNFIFYRSRHQQGGEGRIGQAGRAIIPLTLMLSGSLRIRDNGGIAAEKKTKS